MSRPSSRQTTSAPPPPNSRWCSIKRTALSAGLALALGVGLTPLGCGSSRGSVFAGPGQGDAKVPDDVARQIRTCTAEHMGHLPPGEHSISFDVELTKEGDVDAVGLRESTLGDEGLELCIARALRSISADDLPLGRSENRLRGPVAPEARALLGQTQALSCLTSPPCLLAVAFFIGAAYVTVQIFVHAAAQSSTAKPEPRTAPTATTMPTAAPVDIDCKKVKDDCIETCSDTSLPTPDFGAKFQKCLRACMKASGC